MRTRRTLAFVAALLLSTAARAQAPAPERRTIAVSVLDREGKFVSGLTAANFRGPFRGQRVKVSSASEDSSPRRVALIVDIRGPWVGRQWELVWAGAEDLVRQLTPRHAVAVLAAGGSTVQRTDFVHDPETLLNRLRDLQSRARSAGDARVSLGEVITDGAQGFSPAGFGDVFYAITPAAATYYGDPYTAPTVGRQKMRRELARAGLRLFVLWVGETPIILLGPRGGLTSQWGPKGLEELVESSGGELAMVLRRHKLEELPSLTSPLYEAIAHVYRLEVEFPRAIEKPDDWKLEVVGAGGGELKDVEVVYPHLLAPLTEAPSSHP